MKNVFGGLAIGCGTLIAVAGGLLIYFLWASSYFWNEIPPELDTAAMRITMATPLLMGLGIIAIGVFLIFFVRNPDKPVTMQDDPPVPPGPVPPGDVRRAAPPPQPPQDPR